MVSIMATSHLTLSDLERSMSSHKVIYFEWYEICMVYIYLPGVYNHLNRDATKESLLVGGVFRCASGLYC